VILKAVHGFRTCELQLKTRSNWPINSFETGVADCIDPELRHEIHRYPDPCFTLPV
jgi:hypothetical protein